MNLRSTRRAAPGLAVLLIAGATLLPSGNAQAFEFSACLLCDEKALSDVLANIALYAPLGVGLVVAGATWRRGVLLGALVTGLIELAQSWIPGRDPSVRDMLSNTLGTVLGVFVVATAPHWLRPTRRLATILAGSWAAGAAAVAAATVYLLQPAFPKSVYYGQWTPNLGNLEWYRGRVLEARVGPVAVPSWRAPDSDVLRAELQRRSPITVRALAGPPVPAVGSLFSIADEEQRGILLIGPDRDDLVYRYWSRANAVRLDSPDLRARGLLRGIRAGDSLNVVVSWEDGNLCLSANARRACGLSPGPATGWALVYYVAHFPAWLVTLLNAAWLAALAAPLGYWSPDKRSAFALGAVLVIAVMGAAIYAAAPALVDAAVVAAGLGAGALARAMVRARMGLRG